MWVVTCIAGTPLLGTTASALHIGQRKACPGPMLLLARESCRHCWQKEWRQGRTFGSLKCHSWFLFNRRLGFLYSQEGRTGFLITKCQSSHHRFFFDACQLRRGLPVTDLGFPREGWHQLLTGVCQTILIFCNIFAENFMKWKNLDKGVRPWRPLGSATGCIIERCLIRPIEVSLLYSFSLDMNEPLIISLQDYSFIFFYYLWIVLFVLNHRFQLVLRDFNFHFPQIRRENRFLNWILFASADLQFNLRLLKHVFNYVNLEHLPYLAFDWFLIDVALVSIVKAYSHWMKVNAKATLFKHCWDKRQCE